jgi:2-oxoglutarate dehydrogenase E1 component
MGRARAYQERRGDNGVREVLPVILHGDAAFAGQGITAESLNLATLKGYNLGGTVQVITNNLLGFTALPEESNSSRFASDLAKRLPIPIFHVNAEDPLAVTRIAALAAEFRATFHCDVVVDLVGYRRHGHSEVDDPTVTQPRRYARIKDHPPLYKIYAASVGIDPSDEIARVQAHFLEDQKAATHAEHKPKMHSLPEYWSPYYGAHLRADDNPNTGLDAAEIATLTTALTTAPEGFIPRWRSSWSSAWRWARDASRSTTAWQSCSPTQRC